MKLSKRLSVIYISLITVCLLNCGGTEEEQPETLIFNGVEEITLYGPDSGTAITSDGSFTFYLPGDVAYAVLGIFNSTIDTNSGVIINPENLLAGSRTGMPTWTRGEISADELYIYNNTTEDFDNVSPLFNTTGTSYYWAVWGYDEWGNLTHASPQWVVDITY